MIQQATKLSEEDKNIIANAKAPSLERVRHSYLSKL